MDEERAEMSEDQVALLLRELGRVQGSLIGLKERQIDDYKRLMHRINSAMEASRQASREVAEQDVRLRGENGDNGVMGRLAALERTVRMVRTLLVWVAGVLAVVVAAQVRVWLGLP